MINIVETDDRGSALDQGSRQRSKWIRAAVVLVLDQVSEVLRRLPRVVVRDGEVRSKEPPLADVLDLVRYRWIRSWCSNDPEQVLETCRGVGIELESPSSKHRRNSDSKLT